MVKTIEVHESVYAQNDRAADRLRAELTGRGTTMINVMSGPGSGKTTLLTKLINMLKNDMSIAVMDVDIESDLDASRVADETGVPALQIHNGGLCHIDAEMTTESLRQSDFPDVDLIILENIGNLVCPSEFDTGSHINIMLLSVPEGDDKPLKYPHMFEVCNLCVITKADTLPAFKFDFDACEKRIKDLNPMADVMVVSAKTGDGMEKLARWVKDRVKR